MAYTLVTPYRWETYLSDPYSQYARLSGRRFTGGTIDGPIAPTMTDVPRGQSLLVTGTTVVMTQTPSQDDLAAASYYFLGGHEYVISDEQATVLINAGYSDYVTPIV
jgi:hypothetical protein